MNLVKINLETIDWKIKLSEESAILTGTLDEKIIKILNFLKGKQFDGGVLSGEEVFFKKATRILELGQWLTEKLNSPFVQESKDFSQEVEKIKWTVTYYGYKPGQQEYSNESLLTQGNGFIGLRGTMPEMGISDAHYPATYLAGLYNTAKSEVSNHIVYNEDFVNAPNLQKIFLVIDNEIVDYEGEQLQSLQRTLNLKNGLFIGNAIIALKSGKKVEIKVKKIVNMNETSQYSIQYSFRPLNFSGNIRVVSEADGDVYNYNVARYRDLTKNHLDVTELKEEGTKVALTARTKASKISIFQSSELFSDDIDLSKIKNCKLTKKICQEIDVNAQERTWVSVDKTVSIVQRRSEEPAFEIEISENELPRFESILFESTNAWKLLWDRTAINVTGDLMSQKLLNLHTYHLLCSASPNGNHSLDSSITARGLHGEAYRGHVFWDELFILPFYIIHFPDTARELLMYRYRRLDMARKNAEESEYKGAMYPWQSGLDGSEQSQSMHLNPINGTWKEDHSRLQRHVSLAIAYNIVLYYNNSNDALFMEKYGLEMMLEIAHFWESATSWDDALNRYSISGVMGPDEFHESYPNAQTSGLKNNAYTNVMVAWLFGQIQELSIEFKKYFDRKVGLTEITPESLVRMTKIKNQLALEIDKDGIIAQFEGYFILKDLDWDFYQNKYGNIYRLDRILNAEGLSVDDYKVSKQADTLMMFYNFSESQVNQIVQGLNYKLPLNYLKDNLSYYLNRTSHGSTLSRVVHSHLASMVDNQELSWELFEEALFSDYRDIQGGTTAEGIHTGVMGATLYIPLLTFSGLDIRQNIISFSPKLPSAWNSLAYKFEARGNLFEIEVTHNEISITSSNNTAIKVYDKAVELIGNRKTTFRL